MAITKDWEIIKNKLIIYTDKGMHDLSQKSIEHENDFKKKIEIAEIKEGITKIEIYSFQYYRNLKTLKLPNSLRIINKSAFEGCSNLKAVIIPDGVIKISENAFSNCIKLKTITLPKSIKFIDSRAFLGTPYLTNILIDSKNPYYSSINGILYNKDKTILLHCPERVKGSFKIPESVTKIEEYAFHNCNRLTKIYMPSNIKYLTALSLLKCSKLRNIIIDQENKYFSFYNKAIYNKTKSHLICCLETASGKYNIHKNTRIIEDYAFGGCSHISSINCPQYLKIIKNSAFTHCFSLRNIKLSPNLEVIDNDAFYYCSKLKEVTFPISMKSIGDFIFLWCKKLQKVIYKGTYDDLIKISSYKSFLGLKNGTTKFYTYD